MKLRPFLLGLLVTAASVMATSANCQTHITHADPQTYDINGQKVRGFHVKCDLSKIYFVIRDGNKRFPRGVQAHVYAVKTENGKRVFKEIALTEGQSINFKDVLSDGYFVVMSYLKSGTRYYIPGHSIAEWEPHRHAFVKLRFLDTDYDLVTSISVIG